MGIITCLNTLTFAEVCVCECERADAAHTEEL